MPRHLIGEAHESAYEIFAGDTSVLETLNDTHIHNDIPVGSCLKIFRFRTVFMYPNFGELT